MATYAESADVKQAKPVVVVSGLLIIVGGAMVLAGIWVDLGLLLLVLFLSPTAFLLHPFRKFEGRRQQMEMRGVLVGRSPRSDLFVVRQGEISAVHYSRGAM